MGPGGMEMERFGITAQRSTTQNETAAAAAARFSTSMASFEINLWSILWDTSLHFTWIWIYSLFRVILSSP